MPRYEYCAGCGRWTLTRPIYERRYEGHEKDGRFVRAAWLCDPCVTALKTGGLVRKVDEDVEGSS